MSEVESRSTVYGDGIGNGNGWSDGNGNGIGNGNGWSDGDGNGIGNGNGWSDGDGSGDGNGNSIGNGHGDGLNSWGASNGNVYAELPALVSLRDMKRLPAFARPLMRSARKADRAVLRDLALELKLRSLAEALCVRL